MITEEQADLLVALIEVATEGNWPTVAHSITERGYTPREVVAATNALCEMAHVSQIIEENDF